MDTDAIDILQPLWQQQNSLSSEVHLWFVTNLTRGSLLCVWGQLPHVWVSNMTVLLKNLFTVHFQFDLLKLETNNTRDDELKHAWIIARWMAGQWGISLTAVATSWVENHSIWPPSMQFERAPPPHTQPPPHASAPHPIYPNICS